MARKTVHVVKHDNGWAVRSGGAQHAAKVTRTQSQAIDRAREIAQNRGAELIVHGRNNRFRSVDSFGNDPNPPRDTEH